MPEMRAGLRLPDETGETTPTPVPPPDSDPVASCEGCDALDRRLVEVEAELADTRALIENEVMATFRHHNLRKS